MNEIYSHQNPHHIIKQFSKQGHRRTLKLGILLCLNNNNKKDIPLKHALNQISQHHKKEKSTHKSMDFPKNPMGGLYTFEKPFSICGHF